MKLLLIIAALLFLGCGTHLSSTDTQAEQATQTLAASGYKDHAELGSTIDTLRYQAIYCSSGGILRRAGVSPEGGAGPQCPSAK